MNLFNAIDVNNNVCNNSQRASMLTP